MPFGKALMLADRARREGRIAEAEALCQGALEAQPNSYEAEQLLGVIAHQGGKLDEAIEHFRRTVDLAPQVALHHANLGEMYRLAGRLDEAAASSSQALVLDPEFPEPLNNLARIAITRGDPKGLDYCREAIALKPTFADAYNNLGNILKELGDLEAARQAFVRAIELNPNAVAFYVNLAEVHKFSPGDPHLAAMEALVANSDGLSKSDRMHLDFVLGRAYGDLRDYRSSFRRLLAGNATKRAEVDYDEKSTLALFDHIERVFTSALIEAKSGHGDPSSVPIFVLGMPRSGTTLVEQILSSHPMVYGGGELTAFYETVMTIRGPGGRPIAGPGVIPSLDAKVFSEIGARYLAAIRDLAPGARHITDKRPNNYYFIGLIHLALPNAKIIHLVRDPADNCVSCFSKLFTMAERGELNHTYDLAELGRYYRRYQRLMAHWHCVLPPKRILDVRYENLVADLAGETRRMLTYCGLPWYDRCLAFHETKRPVRTASAAQVRQPIFDSSIGRWRAYEAFLGPLLAELSSSSNG
jgi:Flp pilus assembly protein TadD